MRPLSPYSLKTAKPAKPAAMFQGRVKTKDEIAAKIERMGGYAGMSSVFATLAGLNGYLNQDEPAAQYLMGTAGVSGLSTLGLYALSPRLPKDDDSTESTKGDIQ
jgi:hypothetical protein